MAMASKWTWSCLLLVNKKLHYTSFNKFQVFNARKSFSLNYLHYYLDQQKCQNRRSILQFNRTYLHTFMCGEKNHHHHHTFIMKAVYVVSGLLGAYFYAVGVFKGGVKTSKLSKVIADSSSSDSKLSHNKNNFIVDVVHKAGPAVVFLEIKGRHPFTGSPTTLSNGSGFIVRSNGIILTNAHVVANKPIVSVKLQDGRVMEGQVAAVDPISDLAIVKINANNLPLIPLGTSSTIRPGEWVIAMGSPLSLSNTVTCGIVSSVHRASRELGLRNSEMDYLQTDAVINFGNSGGPLVNLDGHAIGINTMKVTTGISFAIPSDYAINFLMRVEDLMKNGQKENGFLMRRYLGITMLTLTEDVLSELKNNTQMPKFPDIDGGVFVYKVIPGTPAHIGGILAGDIIIDISGKPIKSAADVYDAVEKSDFLKVTLIRGSEKKVIPIDTKQTI